MSKPKIYDAFGTVPDSVAPSIPVRHWDQGLIAGAFGFTAAYLGTAWLGYHAPGTPDALVTQWLPHAGHGLQATMHYLTATTTFTAQTREFYAGLEHPLAVAVRLGTALLSGTTLGSLMAARALKPRANSWHVSGPQLLEGKDAIREARRRSLSPKAAAADPGSLALHPDLVLPKKHWSRHTLIYGAVGSGKTQILLRIIGQMVAKRHKLFLYDVKGDFTSYFSRPIIVSPFDARSYYWDVGQDVRTATQAAAFASSLIPEESGNGKFWSQSAQQLLVGVIRSLQNTRGTDWGWTELADGLARDAASMLPVLQEHYAKAAPLIANTEAQATGSILATLSAYTRVVDDLALAWPTRGKRRFSMTEWIKDDYKGRKQVIVQSGEDEQLARAYIAAMVNVAVPSIISPQLPDNESGRFLGFVFDELTSIGKINIGPLIDKGRSKGVVLIAGMQDLVQLEKVYGKEDAQALSSMVGTHIVCQLQMGDTRERLANLLGKRKIAWRNHHDKAALHEESKGLISPGELTDSLGFRKGSAFGPNKWGIRALVQMSGDLLLLDFQGIQAEKVREGQVAAEWTKGPAGPSRKHVAATADTPAALAAMAGRTPSEEERKETVAVLATAKPKGLSMDEINGFFEEP